MKYHINKIGGNVVKDNDIYTVIDNTDLKNLIISSTLLYSHQKTTGHSHNEQEEIYLFVHGSGSIKIDNDIFPVEEGDLVLIPEGSFHQVFNKSHDFLYFVCFFSGKRTY